MQVASDLAQLVIADLHRRADAARRARGVRKSRKVKRFETNGGSVTPALRGWPWEPTRGR
jgi:hypothetical protein